MIRHVHSILIGLLMLVVGCGGRPNVTPLDRITLFVPGVAGDGSWYDGLYQSLSTGHGPVEVFTWGAPKAAFFANFSDEKIHNEAEQQLADRIAALPASVTRIDLVGHSAGCGVILGALPRGQRQIEQVVLLSPSVSPTYDLKPAMAKVNRAIHVFHSDRDTAFLKWRTGNFGTYDRIKTEAAGFRGFDESAVGDAGRTKVVQHPYLDTWGPFGNDGGHMGSAAGGFAEAVVLPLLRPGASSP